MGRPRITYANVVATLALVVALGGSAVAATSIVGRDGVVNGCYRKGGKDKGALRVVAAKAKCRKSESRLRFNQRGPAGPAGPGATAAAMPSGAVAFFALPACPAGWADYAPAAGRYLVARPPGGALEAAVGTPLAGGENRPTGRHAHDVVDPGHVHDLAVDPILVGGNVTAATATGTADTQASMQQVVPGKALIAKTGISVAAAGAIDGTNAPYLQLQACRRP